MRKGGKIEWYSDMICFLCYKIQQHTIQNTFLIKKTNEIFTNLEGHFSISSPVAQNDWMFVSCMTLFYPLFLLIGFTNASTHLFQNDTPEMN